MKKIGDISIIIGTIIGIGYIFVGLSWFSAERDFTSPDVLEYIATFCYWSRDDHDYSVTNLFTASINNWYLCST